MKLFKQDFLVIFICFLIMTVSIGTTLSYKFILEESINQIDNKLDSIVSYQTFSQVNHSFIIVQENPLKEEALEQLQKHILTLNNVNDYKSWYLEYRELISQYSSILDTSPSFEESYSQDEINLLYQVVEAEIGNGSFLEKVNVASVCFNRIKSEKFTANNLSEVLVPSQFTTISNGRYETITVTEDTILACQFAFEIGDTTGGALFFESSQSNVHTGYAEYIFTDGAGHKFYK